MQILTSFKKTITINFLLIGSLSGEPIGEIIEYKGSAGLQRDGESTLVSAETKPEVLMYDTAKTQNGRMKIQFQGSEQLDLTEHTKVWIDEVYYDPRPIQVQNGHKNGTRHRPICFGLRWKNKES